MADSKLFYSSPNGGSASNFTEQVQIEFIVLKFFLRELKHRKLFYLYIDILPFGKRLREYFGGKQHRNRAANSDHSPFKGVNGANDVVKELCKLNANITGHRGMRLDANTETERITMTINHLIHFFLEGVINDINTFNEIGQSVFDNVCSYLYGTEFVDNAKASEQEMLAKAKTPEGIKEILWNVYLTSGLNCSFDEFEAYYKRFSESGHFPDIQSTLGAMMGRLTCLGTTDDSAEDNGDEPYDEYEAEDDDDEPYDAFGLDDDEFDENF